MVVAFCGCAHERKLSLAEIRRPTPLTLEKMIITEGYLWTNAEEDLLTLKDGELGEAVDLSFLPMIKDVPIGGRKRFQKRIEITHGLAGKRVLVRGRLKVGPIGFMNQACVYIDVVEIKEANQSLQPTTTAVIPAAEQPVRQP